MDINMESVGVRIKKRRNELQLTQTDIFEMCGIRSGALSRIENGTNVPSVILFYKIAQVLACDMQWLLTGFSSNMEIPILSKNEELLLDNFRVLSEDDQNELMEILEIKVRKTQKVRKNPVKSSPSTESEPNDMVG